jgi:hypothetical protein
MGLAAFGNFTICALLRLLFAFRPLLLSVSCESSASAGQRTRKGWFGNQRIKLMIGDWHPGLSGLLQFDVRHRRMRIRDWYTVLAHSLKVKLDRLADVVLDFLNTPARRDAPWQVRNIRGKIVRALLDDNRVFPHGFPVSPACLRTLLSVPVCRSSPGWPGTVTRPFLIACLYWRWLPRVRTCSHPSFSISRIRSRTFTLFRIGLPAHSLFRRRLLQQLLHTQVADQTMQVVGMQPQ